MIAALHVMALAGYLIAWGLQLRAFRRRDAADTAGWRVAGASVGLHVIALLVFLVVYRSLPLVGLGPASSTLALTIALLVLIASVREDARPAGLLLFPLIALLLGEAVVVGIEPTPQQTGFRGLWLVAHVGTVFVGYAALLLASAAAVMYVFQFRALKRKRFGSVFRFFPSLDTLDWLNRVGLGLGLPALTLGMLAGWSWTLTYGQGLAWGDPQVVFGVVTWVAYLGAVVARLNPDWRGTRSALASGLAFVVTFAAFTFLRMSVPGSEFFL